MKTLKESLLADVETSMTSGTKMVDTYKKAEQELNDIKKLCGDLSNWTGYEQENITEFELYKGIKVVYRIFIKCSKLSKLFDLIGKNLFISLVFSPGYRWSVKYQFTNANQAHRLPDDQNHLFIKHFKQAFEYQYKETGYKPGAGSRSKYTPEEIIEKLILPKFENIETFKSEIVDVSKALEKENTVVKYIDGPNI
jgi:hypothetical protein